jgi:phage shock protein C
MKKLYRDKENKMIGGVLSGMGNFIGIDPTLVRIVYVFLTLVTGFLPGIVLYILFLFIIPEKDGDNLRDTDEPEGPPFRPWK